MLLANQRPSQTQPDRPLDVRGSVRPVFTAGRLFAAAALYLLLALVPPSPFEKPLFMLDLVATSKPTRVAVPVARVAARDLRNSWGFARSGGRRHEGIDIFAPRGTPVLAATRGLVWRIGRDPLGGQVVWVLGPGGQMHYYAHLDRYAAIREGDRIEAGRVLGAVGTTGNARGGPPHLHYGIYQEGGAIDPYPLLVAPPDTSLRDPASRPRGQAALPR